ncbi:hypothetical protein CAPTEDRAFT_197457 [Capitella teleta]|uniref:G-protein coupled receptors family 1 profile domain-containing protein n=1 Tax=Capitella teleta TaxID=283909 RepID=R7T9R6_CAPTE|nr:hypothetical protein CAPTEDRAFT_197457 [Capitella teleta]|eukprot:ELT90439.1 hypothetical protein CAPTEDRAFT_197457 [Capitella teleta]
MYSYSSKLSSFYLYNLNAEGADRGSNYIPGLVPPGNPVTPVECLNTTCLPDNTTSVPSLSMGLSERALQVEKVGYVYVMPALCVVCVVLNLLTILVFHQGAFRTPIYAYLTALAAADTVTGAVTLPVGMSRCSSCGVSYTEMVYEVFVFVPVSNMSEGASAWFVVILAVERLLAVTSISVDKTSATAKRRARFVVVAVFVASVLFNLPYFFVITIQRAPFPMAMQTKFGASLAFDVFSWIRATLVQFAPLVVLIILNCFLLREVYRSSKRYQKLVRQGDARNKAQQRLTWMLVGTVVLFIAGNIPVAFSYTILFGVVFGETRSNDLYAIFRVITHLVAIASYALDFVVYCGVNRHFRDALTRSMSCKGLQRKVSDVTPSSNKTNLTPTKY